MRIRAPRKRATINQSINVITISFSGTNIARN